MSVKDKFILNLSEKLVNDGVCSELAYKIAKDVASEYVGQPIQPLIDYYKSKYLSESD